MKSEFIIQNLVLLSKKSEEFRPSEFNQYWLHSKDIIDASQVNEISIFSPGLTQAITPEINLIVTPEQIQIAPSNVESAKEIISKNAVLLVKSMEHFSLNAMGLNFNWLINDDLVDSSELSKRYFFCQNNPASDYFKNSGNALFGGYLSTDIDSDIRLKLDIKPVHLSDTVEGIQKQTIQFGFNFHSDLKIGNQRDKVIEILENYDKWFNISKEIIQLFN